MGGDFEIEWPKLFIPIPGRGNPETPLSLYREHPSWIPALCKSIPTRTSTGHHHRPHPYSGTSTQYLKGKKTENNKIKNKQVF